MMKSLYSGVAGLKTHNQKMDVIGNNIANVNTTGYKTSTTTFQDVFYQSRTSTSSGDATVGAKNPTQTGYGVRLNAINQVMTQSGFTYSDNYFDCAIEGSGFFQVMDEAGNIYYTRSGVFSVDDYGNLIDANKSIVLGVAGDATGMPPSQQRINLFVPDVDDNIASATREIDGIGVHMSASDYGPNGNISFTIVDGDSPYATLSGSNLRIEMDLHAEYADIYAFEDAVNEAIRAGGVDLGEGVLPIQFEIDGVPTETAGVAASNVMELSYVTNAADVAADPETEPEYSNLNLAFTTNLTGEFGNAIEVDIQTSSASNGITARWADKVLTISLPEAALNEDGELVEPTITLNAIQNAIYKAAGCSYTEEITEDMDDAAIAEAAAGGIIYDITTGNDEKLLTVGIATYDEETGMLLVDEEGEFPDGEEFSFTQALDGTRKRIGLAEGRDNFFAGIGQKLGTVKLEDGRYHAAQTTQDLKSIVVSEDGTIYGIHSVHGTIPMGRIDIVTFENPTGLDQVGSSYWQESRASGAPNVKNAGEEGAGVVVSYALEMSNVDLSQEFSDMIITQRGFQANSRIITVADTMLEELVNLKR